MGKPCTFCRSSRRQELETAILEYRLNQVEAGQELGVSKVAVHNHMRNHVTADLQAARKQLGFDRPVPPDILNHEVDPGLNVYNELLYISSVTSHLLKEAIQDQNIPLTLRVMERMEKQLEFQAKLQGLFKEGPNAQINILVNDEWQRLKTIILTTLESFPEAKEAIAKRLLQESPGSSNSSTIEVEV